MKKAEKIALRKYQKASRLSDLTAAAEHKAGMAYHEESDIFLKAELLKTWRNIKEIHDESWAATHKAFVEYEATWTD